MVEFLSVASSSQGCAYILRAPGGAPPLLLDAGVRFQLIQQVLGFTVSKLAGCLVTHAHGDHCAAVPELLKAGVEVYGSEGFWQTFRHGIWGDHHRAHVVKAETQFKVGPWSVKGFDVVHDAEDTLGFLVSGYDDKVLYLTDTAYSKYKFEGVTVMAIEANWGEEHMRASSASGRIHGERFRRTASNHMSIERLERLLDANDLSSLREVHLLHLSDANSDAEEFKRRVMRKTGVPVYVAAKDATKEVPF
jgi:phosphoribosyl 1,2-cyclic phosphodiesterase